MAKPTASPNDTASPSPDCICYDPKPVDGDLSDVWCQAKDHCPGPLSAAGCSDAWCVDTMDSSLDGAAPGFVPLLNGVVQHGPFATHQEAEAWIGENR